MMETVSPITKKNNTAIADTFSAKDVSSLYREQLGMDVNRFFSKDHFHLFRCRDTGYRFYHPDGLDGDGKFYEELQHKLGAGYYHPWKFENQVALDLIRPGDKVLDIGCGVGNFLIRAKEKASEVTGLELNEHAAQVCRDKGIEAYNERIQEHAEKKEGHYDVVCMFQVLEHIYDVKGFLDAAITCVKPGGTIVIGVPNNEPYFLGYDKYQTLNLPPHHMGLWNREVFEKMAPLFGLRITDVKYDVKGRIAAEAYTRAKYITGIKSLPGKHSLSEKIRLVMAAIITTPLTIIKKFTKGLHGSHIAVVLEKK